MLQTLEREHTRSLRMASSGVSKGSRDYFCSPSAQGRTASTSMRHWTWLEFAQEALGARQELPGQVFEVIDLFSEDAQTLWLADASAVEDPTAQILSCRDCARMAAQHLALNKSDLAKLFTISRPTLYSWISGEAEPREEGHRQRLAFLGGLANELFNGSSRPLYHRFVYERMPNETVSIYETLEASSWDETLLKRLFYKAGSLTAQRDEDLGTRPGVSGAQQEQNLQDNLLGLGGL